MRTASLVFSLGLCQALLLGLEPKSRSDNFKEDFHYSYAMQPGGRLSVENFNGAVEISGWDQNTIDVTGTKYAETADLLKAIKVEVSVSGGVARVRSSRPGEVRGNMGVRYQIRAPRRTALDPVASSNGRIAAADLEGPARLVTSNGAVSAARIRGDLNVTTSNGSVRVEDLDGGAQLTTSNGGIHCTRVRGTVQARTSNGGVHVDLTGSKAGEPVRVETSNGGVDLRLGAMSSNPVHAVTSNGGITLEMPAGANARVKAVTSAHARVSSDFDVRREGPESRSRLEGQIGNGGALIELSTSNGGIHLKKL